MILKTWISIAAASVASVCLADAWPVLKTYEGDALRRVRMPMGGIGTGTISLSGRGALVDWETNNRPAKGFVPTFGFWAPHFAIRVKPEGGKPLARVLEGPVPVEDYEGATGCGVINHGLPRFQKAVFKAAYPFAQVELTDSRLPLSVWVEAFNPLVPGDADASGIPAVLLRWRIRSEATVTSEVSVAGTLLGDGVRLFPPKGIGTLTEARRVSSPGWNVGLDRYWRRFVREGVVGDTVPDEREMTPVRQTCVSFRLAPGEEKVLPFVLAWRSPDRKAWNHYDDKDPKYTVGNWYAVRYPTVEAVAEDFCARLGELEAKTLDFVRKVLAAKVPEVVKEAALFNLSTLRTETCFRTADGRFFGWEGCYDDRGSCPGNCSHVWGYEHALVDLWPDLAKTMSETYFVYGMDQKTGGIVNRVALPLDGPRIDPTNGGGTIAAADGQMQCLIKACEIWRKTGDDAWLSRLWPRIRKAMEFCWIEGGWDGDVDGVMEGCQHNTMDVEYYGPNPQMEFLYLAALEAVARMAEHEKDLAFAAKCRDLKSRGSAWTEANLFNGRYYEHRIVPPKGPIADGLRDPRMGARDLSDPDFQLGSGCLIDQLLGDYAARAAGLPSVVDAAHAVTTLGTILACCRENPDGDRHNFMRSFAMPGETSLRMAWYDETKLPRSPFPYATETMTGFEYVVAALLAWNGEYEKAERVVRDIRARYDGVRRNPFDEAECGHHYSRALSSWSVFRAFGALSEFAGSRAATTPDDCVSEAEMRAVYEQVKTPYKYGVVLEPEAGHMVDNPNVFRQEGKWYMIYIDFDGKGYETRLAESDDLIRWRRKGLVLPRGKSGEWDSAQADGWPILLDDDFDGSNTLHTFEGRYWMMYLGGALTGYETDPLSEGVAWTSDPTKAVSWNRYEHNPVLRPSDQDARLFEQKTIYKSFVIQDRLRRLGGRFISYYNAKQKGKWVERIGIAVSDDLRKWRRFGAGPCIANTGELDNGICGDPMVRRVGEVYVMFFFGFNWDGRSTRGAFDTFAASRDLVHWTRWKGPHLVEPSEPWDRDHAHKPWVIRHNGVVYHFYCAVGDRGRTIAVATSVPLTAEVK